MPSCPWLFRAAVGTVRAVSGTLRTPRGMQGVGKARKPRGKYCRRFHPFRGNPCARGLCQRPETLPAAGFATAGALGSPQALGPPTLRLGYAPQGRQAHHRGQGPPLLVSGGSCACGLRRRPDVFPGDTAGGLCAWRALKRPPPFAQRPFPAGLGVTPPSIPPPRPGTVCGWLRGAQRPCRARQTGALAGSGG